VQKYDISGSNASIYLMTVYYQQSNNNFGTITPKLEEVSKSLEINGGSSSLVR